MIFIGITGGVGAGKSEILKYLDSKPRVRVMLADEIAHQLMEPGEDCYNEICRTFSGEEICKEGEPFDRIALAKLIFSDEEKRLKLNAIVHPAVKSYVDEQYRLEKEAGTLDILVLEAALLIEEHYDEICDELWYIYTSEQNRRSRLKASRGYSDEKIDGIFASQMSEEAYRASCDRVIDNNGTVDETIAIIDSYLESLDLD